MNILMQQENINLENVEMWIVVEILWEQVCF